MTGPQLTKLQALLDRVQRNAAAPRRIAPPASEVVEPRLVAVAPVSAEVARTESALHGSEEEPPAFTDAAVDDVALADAEYADDADVLELDAADEEPPESSRRVAASMDEALAGAAERLEAPKTIPPESGAEPRSDAHGELELPRGPSRGPDRPTTEQLGQTVSLEEGPSTDFELDEPLSEPLHEPLSERVPDASLLEAELPSGAGADSEDLASPPGAREELERVRLGEVQATVISRPIISTNVVEFIEAHGRQKPQSFGALLDETLSLAGD